MSNQEQSQRWAEGSLNDNACFSDNMRSAKPPASPVRQRAAMFERMSKNCSPAISHPPHARPIGDLVRSRHDWLFQQQQLFTGFTKPNSTSCKGSQEVSAREETRHDSASFKSESQTQLMAEEREAVEAQETTGRCVEDLQAQVSVQTEAEPEPITPPPAPFPDSPTKELAQHKGSVQTPPTICTSSRDIESKPSPMDVEELIADDQGQELHTVVSFTKHNRSFTRVTVIESTRSEESGISSKRNVVTSPESPALNRAVEEAEDRCSKPHRDYDRRRLRVVSSLSSSDEWKLVRVDSGAKLGNPFDACETNCLGMIPACTIL